MNTDKGHGKKSEAAESSVSISKAAGEKKRKSGSASYKSGNALGRKRRGFDDLDEMRKDIDALGGLIGDDGRPFP